MISAEVAVYPLKTSDGSSAITNSIEMLSGRGVEYSVGSMSTFLQGSEDAVWSGLQDMFRSAQNFGEVSMVITLTNAAD